MTVTTIRIHEPNWFRKQWRQSPERCWLGVTVAIGFVLRVIRLGAWPYWHDEAFNLIKARYLGEHIRGDLMSNHPPLFATLVALWRACGLGDDECTMRLLPVFLGVAGIVAIHVLGKELFGARAGLCAAFFLAIAPFHVYHSQDLKPYILLPAVATFSVYFLWRAAEENRPALWAAYALTAGLACYAEFFAGPLLVAVNLWFLVTLRGRRDRLPGWCIANTCGALLFAPFLAILASKVGAIMINAEVWWVPKPEPRHVVFYLKTIAFGYAGPDPEWKIALVLFSAASMAGFVIAWRAKRRAALLLSAWFAIPVAIVYVVSLFTNSIFLYRAMLPYALPCYLLTGVALAHLPRPAFRAVGVAAFAAMAALPLYQRYAGIYHPEQHPHRPGIHPPRDYDLAARHILDNWQEGDIVVHASAATWLPFYWYGFDENPHQHFGGIGSGFLRDIREGNPRHSRAPQWDAYFPRELQRLVEGKPRIWYVFSEWERGFLKGNPLSVWRWLDMHYSETARTRFRGIDVFLYESERDGTPIVKTTRDRDDGVSARVAYGSEAYEKTVPDTGLVPTPVEERAGNLILAFEEIPAVGSAQNPQAAPIRFAVENRSGEDVRATVSFQACDVLLGAASLYEPEPESDVWRFTPMCHPDEFGAASGVPVASARFGEAGTAALTGELALPPGAYTTAVYLFGTPGDGANGRAQVSIAVNGTELLPSSQNGRNHVDGWHWIGGSRFTVAPEAPAARVVITARAFAPGAAADVGYIAIRSVREAAVASQPGAILPDWPGEVTIPAGGATPWTGQFEGGASRVDVWVREQGADARAYHIFRTWEGTDALEPPAVSP